METTQKLSYNRLNVIYPDKGVLSVKDEVIYLTRYYKALVKTPKNYEIWGDNPQIQWIYSTDEYLGIVNQTKDLPAEVYSEVVYQPTVEETDYILGVAWVHDINTEQSLWKVMEELESTVNLVFTKDC